MKTTYTFDDLLWDKRSATKPGSFSVPLKEDPDISISVKQIPQLLHRYATLSSFVFYNSYSEITKLEHETTLLSRLDQNSNFVIKYYGKHIDSEYYYIFTEYGNYGDFNTLLKPELSYSEKEIWIYLTSVALGLNSLICLGLF